MPSAVVKVWKIQVHFFVFSKHNDVNALDQQVVVGILRQSPEILRYTFCFLLEKKIEDAPFRRTLLRKLFFFTSPQIKG
jgi:hypothetical protein